MNENFFDVVNAYDNIPIIAWGAGCYYNLLRGFLKSINVKYIYDRKWVNKKIAEYDGLKVVSDEEIKDGKKKIIIICIFDIVTAKELETKLKNELEESRIYLLRNLSPIGREIKKNEIIYNSKRGVYSDYFGNRIKYLTENSLDNIRIRFEGENASVILGKDVKVVNELFIKCGNNTKVMIGNNTTFDNTTIFSSYADIIIGEDCMFSYNVMLRNHDSHFIFQKGTGERINYSKNILIKNHVWIGQGSLLLSGFSIGNESIVGANSVSSSKFPNNVIIAGNSAKIIREDITWDREMTWIYDYDNISEIEKK